MKKQNDEITSLNLDDVTVEQLEDRLELAAAFPSWCCNDCSRRCVEFKVEN